MCRKHCTQTGKFVLQGTQSSRHTACAVTPPENMKIRVNGEEKTVRPNLNVYDLLTALELNPTQAGIAVAVDREVIPKTKWPVTELREGSDIEIIRAVQGG